MKKRSAATAAILTITLWQEGATGFAVGNNRFLRFRGPSRLDQPHHKSSPNKCIRRRPKRRRILGSKRPSSFSALRYTHNGDAGGSDSSKSAALYIDTSCYDTHTDAIQSWLASLSKVERSEPTWLCSNGDDNSSDIMTISPSLLIQEHFDAMYTGFRAPVLFPTEADRVKFDFEWRYALLSVLPQSDLDQVLTEAQSNSHPLSMYLAAIPPDCCLSLHAHAAIEVFLPLVGCMHERRAMNVALERDMLCRGPDMEVNGMGGLFTSRPSPEEIATVARDISDRIVFPDCGERGAFTERSVSRGQVELNPVGSVHQSFTTPTDENSCGGSLLFIVGSRVFGHFRRKGSFLQREGIDMLENIDDIT
jgi:hypothetical protein